MQKSITKLPEIKLIGITTRTNLANEMNRTSAKIGPTAQEYFHEKLAAEIPHRKMPGTTYSVYTEYESDFTGSYTYFIGEEVTLFDGVPKNFKTLTIKPQTYVKFTTEPGPMPTVVIEAWKKIWGMGAEELGGNRNYIADFEIYDERAADPQKVVLDIYIGITKNGETA